MRCHRVGCVEDRGNRWQCRYRKRHAVVATGTGLGLAGWEEFGSNTAYRTGHD